MAIYKEKVEKLLVASDIKDKDSLLTDKSNNDLFTITKTTESKICKVEALGSDYSFSDVVQIDDLLINTDELYNPLSPDNSLLKNNLETSFLVYVENCIKKRKIIQYFNEHFLAHHNMGGYNEQPIVIAAPTSTQG